MGWRSWRDTVLIPKLHDSSHPEAHYLDGLCDDLADAYGDFEKCNDLRNTMGLCKVIRLYSKSSLALTLEFDSNEMHSSTIEV